MQATLAMLSHPGDRRDNQDCAAYACSREAILLVLADGLGGHEAGDRASEAAVRTLLEAFALAARPRLSDPTAFLAQGFYAAHHAVHALARTGGYSPRTTLVAALVQENQLWYAHAGDSRLYFCRAGKMRLRTRDHSHAQWLCEQGVIAADQLRRHPKRHLLRSALGGTEITEIAFGHDAALCPGDVVALCSDGVWEAWKDEDIAERLAWNNLRGAVETLVHEAVSRTHGEADNATLVALRWGGEAEIESDGAAEEAAVSRKTSDEEVAIAAAEPTPAAVVSKTFAAGFLPADVFIIDSSELSGDEIRKHVCRKR